MGLVQTIKFSDFSLHKLVRFDLKYLNYKLKKNKILNPIKVKEIINSYFKGFAFKGEDFNSSGKNYVLKGDLFNDDFSINFNKMQYLDDIFLDTHYKFKLNKNDIVISLVGSIGKMVIIDNDYNMLLNQNNISLQVNNKLVNNKFFSYILKQEIYDLASNIYGNSGYSFLSIDDLFNLEIPNIDLSSQIKAIKKIEPIEKKIQKLKSQRKKHLEIINDVFSQEFDYDKNLWKTFGKGMTAGTQKSNDKNMQIYKLKLSQINKSTTCRVSSRFHNPITQKLNNILNSKNTIKINNIISKNIQRGVSPKYNNNGNISVVKTAQLKNNYIDLKECDFVTNIFLKEKEKARLLKNDVLIASTGKVSLGKIDINTFNIDLLADGHITILRVNNDKYNPLFLTYFLRSILGTYQIERDYTGATNQIELYSTEIGNFKIPDFTLEKQQKIVDNIKTKIDVQKDIENQIKQKQDSISLIIEDTIKKVN
jgi:type I restriction enzyme S subunit